MECPYCKSQNIIKGYLMSSSRICFVQDSDKWSLMKNVLPVEACVCKDCGMIAGLKLKEPGKLNL